MVQELEQEDHKPIFLQEAEEEVEAEVQITTIEHTENSHIKKGIMYRQEIRITQKKVKQKKTLRTRRKKISQMIEKDRRHILEIDLGRDIALKTGQDQGIGQMIENPETIAQGVEEGILEIDLEKDTEIVDIETPVVTEAVPQALHADIEEEMTTPAIGTAEGHAKRP